MEIKNVIALITGGSKGIGYGIARSILNEGGKVAITSRSKERAEDAANRLKQETNNNDIFAFGADVKNVDDQKQITAEIKQKWGDLNLVVANAGLGHFGTIEDLTEEQWHETIDTNLTGVFNTIKASVDNLKSSKGFFITISSLAGTNFFKGGAAYNASKFGLTGFTQAVMLDLRQYGIRVSTIMPGSVSTHFNGNEPDDSGAWKIQIEDIGEMVINLVKLNARTLPSKIEVRPSQPPS